MFTITQSSCPSNSVSHQEREIPVHSQNDGLGCSLDNVGNRFEQLSNRFPGIIEKIFYFLPTKEDYDRFHDVLKTAKIEPHARHSDELKKILQANEYDINRLKRCEKPFFNEILIKRDENTQNLIIKLKELNIVDDQDHQPPLPPGKRNISVTLAVDYVNTFHSFPYLHLSINRQICSLEPIIPIPHSFAFGSGDNNSMIQRMIFPETLFNDKHRVGVIFEKIMKGTDDFFSTQKNHDRLLSALFIARLIDYLKERKFDNLDCNKIDKIVENFPFLAKTAKAMLAVFPELDRKKKG